MLNYVFTSTRGFLIHFARNKGSPSNLTVTDGMPLADMLNT
jgi:hypothetical protein